MRSTPFLLSLGLILSLICGGAAVPDEGPSDRHRLMERKLVATQQILTSLTREDYAAMQSAADDLLELARQQWTTDESPRYRAHLKDFWITLEGVSEAAEEKKLDGATLAYVQMTISCVKCHKYLRQPVE
ncbi:hypothetical protein [Maioricimonas rarisocia]|nr:hypothetical protein [Maioricimonas rarisocia]